MSYTYSKKCIPTYIVVVDVFTKFVFLKTVPKTKTIPVIYFSDHNLDTFEVPKGIIWKGGAIFTNIQYTCWRLIESPTFQVIRALNRDLFTRKFLCRNIILQIQISLVQQWSVIIITNTHEIFYALYNQSVSIPSIATSFLGSRNIKLNP